MSECDARELIASLTSCLQQNCHRIMTTTIKTINGSDMRRFTVTDEATAAAGAFASLQRTISDAYGLPASSTGVPFSLSFVDDEGDTCYMGSDTEMVEAVRFAAKNASRTLKLIVTPIVPKEAAPTPAVMATPVPSTTSDTVPATTNGDPSLVTPPVGNIAPVFPGKAETRSKLHAHHALTFAYGLSNRYCDHVCTSRHHTLWLFRVH